MFRTEIRVDKIRIIKMAKKMNKSKMEKRKNRSRNKMIPKRLIMPNKLRKMQIKKQNKANL
jgi:hypothetical protein